MRSDPLTNLPVRPDPVPFEHTGDSGILDAACAALHRTTGITARAVPAATPDRPGEWIIEIEGPAGAIRHPVIVRHVDRVAAIPPPTPADVPSLLVAPRLTAALADACRDRGQPFIDTVGNAYLKAPGMLVLVKGERTLTNDVRNVNRASATTTATALRVVFVLLCRPEAFLNAPYRTIVEAAGVAQGAIGKVLRGLDARRFLIGGEGASRRALVDPGRLLDEWVINYPTRLRPKLRPLRFQATHPEWWASVDASACGVLWGGEIAADRLTHYLKPATVTIYLRDRNALGRFVMDHRLRADPQGGIEILDAFWNFPPDPAHPDLVPPILAYADLVATGDPRALEVARILRAQHIDRANGSA